MDFTKQLIAHRQLCLSSTLAFTRLMYQHLNNKPYIVGELHRRICAALDKVINGETRRLIINISPRSGKTLLVSQMFIAKGFAHNPASRFLHLSYSGSLTQSNSIAVKDIINSPYYKSMFEACVRYGSDTKSRWSTEQGGEMYATSTLGQITGFGAGAVRREGEPWSFSGAIVIDDPLKPEEAMSDNVREQVNLRFETTIRNRLNSSDTPIVVIMQRLHEHDLSGYLQEVEPGEWDVLSLPILYKDEVGTECSLWDFKFPVDEMHRLREINEFVFETQYMQNPTPLVGLMYRPFKTYDIVPSGGRRYCCIDSADTGGDWLCAIFFEAHKEAYYIIDVLYTKRPMEYTEQAVAIMAGKHNTEIMFIEANNGGRIFGRNVEAICRKQGNMKTAFFPFVQRKNKEVRIFARANEVSNMIVVPTDWERRWVDFARDVKYYRKEGRNAHDDAPDCLTMIVEKCEEYANMKSDKDLLNDFL